MRVQPKPAAVSAAATFLLLLLFDLTWPGHGVWLLVVGILIGLAAGCSWWRDRYVSDPASPSGGQASPFSNVGAYGLTGNAVRSVRQPASGVPLSVVLAPVSVLAILLFIGGAIGSAEPQVEEASTSLEQNVSVIDRSGDGELVTPQVAPPAAVRSQQPQTATTAVTVSPAQTSETNAQALTEEAQSSAPVRPIVVAAPQAASPAEAEAEGVSLALESANTFEYTVEEGDTLYDIALRYDSSVDALMSLNELDASSFIHPGDILLIPIAEAEGEES